MNAIPFDTLKFAKRLKEAGFTEQQAEALAAAEAEFVQESLATKQDVVEVKRDIKEGEAALKRDIKELDVKIEQFRAELKHDIKELDVKIEQFRVELKRDIKELETSLKRDMKDLEYRMTIKLGAMLVVAVGAMAALVKVL
ncbi:MAG: coiled-coil domain-containing protein [Gammaproteobacteria bacterium]